MKTDVTRRLVLAALSSGMLAVCSRSKAAEVTGSPLSDGSVARAAFTTAIVDREPADQVVTLDNSVTKVFFFTDLRHLEGRTVTHRWEYNGQVVSEVPFEVGGPRWRVNSFKELDPTMLGKWTVLVVDQSGWPLYAADFLYRQKSDAPATR
jgi:hypothetical protein